MKVSWTIEGGEELAQALANLSTRLNRKVMREVLVEGAEPIRQTAESLAWHDPGPPDIRDNIGVSFPRKSFLLDVRSEVAVVAIGPVRGFAYGLPNEIGSIHQPARPVMRPALDSKANEAIRIIGEASWRELAARGISQSVSVPTDVQSEGDIL